MGRINWRVRRERWSVKDETDLIGQFNAGGWRPAGSWWRSVRGGGGELVLLLEVISASD